MKVYYTKNAQADPPWGAFDDEIIFRSREDSESFVMREDEFDWLMHQLFDNWQQKRSPFIQILKEWQACKDIESQASLIQDVADTIAALRMVKPPVEQ